MNISMKNVFNYNYGSRFWLIISILSPIFGICVLLSVFDVLPRFPLTESMTGLTAILIMLVCISITLLGIVTLNKIIAKLRNIITNGKVTIAMITDIIAIKHQVLVKYEFQFDGVTCKDEHNLAKKLDYKADYSKGKEIKIYALKNIDGTILSAPDIY
ncbi:MAG: hypothetical protein K0R34_363 [Herbinix sp.]|nr:hypothetical protein [Herbinix sp.]